MRVNIATCLVLGNGVQWVFIRAFVCCKQLLAAAGNERWLERWEWSEVVGRKTKRISLQMRKRPVELQSWLLILCGPSTMMQLLSHRTLSTHCPHSVTSIVLIDMKILIMQLWRLFVVSLSFYYSVISLFHQGVFTVNVEWNVRYTEVRCHGYLQFNMPCGLVYRQLVKLTQEQRLWCTVFQI